MECAIKTLIACLSLYLDTGIIITDLKYTEVELRQNDWTYVARSRNPYGKLAFVVEAPLSSGPIVSLGCGHDSSLRTNKDQGKRFCEFNLRWHLFGARR